MGEIKVNVEVIAGDDSGVYKLPDKSKIIDLLDELGQNPETVVIKRNGKIVPEDEELESGDEIVIVPVVSGG